MLQRSKIGPRWGLALLALAATLPSRGLAEPLDAQAIGNRLIGNSILNPSFGCVHYPDAGHALLYRLDGTIERYRWWSEGGRYFSDTGGCALGGCRVTADGRQLRFSRDDGLYDRTVEVIRGNACEAGLMTT
ncbi:MAG: hypothetical protein KDJ80_07180 [Nitratireductor sp.]|nr:hypothetical protein [Nitratireductor sp.]